VTHGAEKVSVIVPEPAVFGKRERLTNPNKIKGFGDKVSFSGGSAFKV
jgi:hypothetical protein